jgi:RNA polymerase sigma-70 factor, ECF subfamily
MSYDEFYRAQRHPILRLCYLATLDAEAAADAAQEALTRAWQHWPTIADSRPDAWLRTVALNLCRSRWRKLGREKRLRQAHVEVPAHLAVRDLDLLRAMQRLPQRQREAIALHYWGDLTIEACAEAMGTSPGSVKQHLARAKARLQSELTIPLEALA